MSLKTVVKASSFSHCEPNDFEFTFGAAFKMSITNYPVFRRYSDLNTWFKIISRESFTELKRNGKYFSLTEFKARIHPERMFINDLVNCEVNTIEISTEDEFGEMKKKWEKELIEVKI